MSAHQQLKTLTEKFRASVFLRSADGLTCAAHFPTASRNTSHLSRGGILAKHPSLVATRHHLSGLPALVPRLERRWRRRPEGDCVAPGTFRRSRHRCRMDITNLSISDGRLRL